MTVVTLASRRAVPTTPSVNAVHQMPRNGTFSAPDETELVRLHAQACNALHAALHHLTGPDCTPAMWERATARALRGLSALKQAGAMVNQVEG